jgi:small subunit ribosomal protein S1
VLDVDERDRKISLGMKQIEPNPWSVIEEKYPVGTNVSGAVRNVTNFGVFVGLEEGIDGLVHVSDISWTEQIKHPSEKFNKGDMVEAVVLKIDKENEKFSLGIKQLQENPWNEILQKFPVGSEITGPVTNVADFGAFVMAQLKDLDQVAYVRFASVYRQFEDIEAFMDEVRNLVKHRP